MPDFCIKSVPIILNILKSCENVGCKAGEWFANISN